MEIYDSFFYNLPFSEILALVILCFQIPKWDNECCCQVLHCCLSLFTLLAVEIDFSLRD
jgi:hypothetical protein